MLLDKDVWLARAKKLIYSWLIFCLGGVGSLTYFDGFLPGHEHGQHPFHVTILEEVDHHHEALPARPEPDRSVQQMRLGLVSRFMPNADFFTVSTHLAPGLAQFFGSGLSDGYILTVAHFNIFKHLALSYSVPAIALIGCSAWLAPPEKPPSV